MGEVQGIYKERKFVMVQIFLGMMVARFGQWNTPTSEAQWHGPKIRLFYCEEASKCFSMVRVNVSSYELTNDSEYLSKWAQITVNLSYSMLTKSYEVPSRSRGFLTEVTGRSKKTSARHTWADWLVIDNQFNGTVKQWFQTNHRRHTKHNTISSRASLAKGGWPECPALSEGVMNLAISHPQIVWLEALGRVPEST